jgi:hypothetical protein
MEIVQHTLPVSRTTVETDNARVTKEFKTGKPTAYTSTEGVYVDGTLFKAGEPFVTDKPKGSTWDEVDPKERAAAAAASETKGDVNLDAMDVSALKAFAASKGIDIGTAKSKAELITVIRAADEPTL